METWQELLRKKSIASLEALAARFGPEHVGEIDRLRQAAENFEFRISPAMVDLIKSPGDPIWRRYVPTVQELEVHDGLVDSLDEDANSPVPNITHRYPDRALFLVSPVCASYCRFCTRRRKVGDPEKIPMAQLESAFRYLEQHHEIRDVIMSGGDPLLLSDRRIDEICKRLRTIPHLEPDPLPPPRAGDAGAVRDPQAIPPALHQHAFQPPRRADSRRGHRAGHARRRRDPAGLPDGAPQRRQRQPGDHEAADAAAARCPRAALLHLYVRPGGGRRALPHDRCEGARDHRGAQGLDVRARRAPLRDRRAGRRRQNSSASGVRREAHRHGSHPAELHRQIVPVQARREGTGARADPGGVTELTLDFVVRLYREHAAALRIVRAAERRLYAQRSDARLERFAPYRWTAAALRRVGLPAHYKRRFRPKFD